MGERPPGTNPEIFFHLNFLRNLPFTNATPKAGAKLDRIFVLLILNEFIHISNQFFFSASLRFFFLLSVVFLARL